MFAGSCAGVFFALDPPSGDPLWSYDVTQDGRAASFHGNVLFTSDVVVVGNDGEGAHLYAFERDTGKVRWLHPTGRGAATDVLGDESALYVVTIQDEVLCLDTVSGDLHWSFVLGEIPSEVATIGSTPALVGGTLYAAGLAGTVHALDAASGKPLWSKRLVGPVSTGVFHREGLLYVGTADGQVYGLDPNSGDIVVENSLEPRTGGMFVAAGERNVVYLAPSSSESEIAAFDPALRLAWRVVAPDGYWSTARPLVYEGYVLAGTNTGLLCAIDVETGSIAWCHEVDPEWDWDNDNVRVVGADGRRLFVGTVGGRLLAFELQEP